MGERRQEAEEGEADVIRPINPKHRVTPSGRALASRRRWRGLPVHIENEVGSKRVWKRPDGSTGSTLMRWPYGYVPLTRGVDGDHLDVYLGPHEASNCVFVVRQHVPETGAYDEDKVMLGFKTLEDARQAYLGQYDDPRFLGEIEEITWGDFAAYCIDRTNWGSKVRALLEKALVELYLDEKSVGTTSAASARASVRAYARNPKNRAKLRAKWRVQAAKRSGKLKPPSKCPSCGRSGVKLDFHHNKGHGSNKGVWRCRRCHSRQDNKRHGAAMRASMKKAKKRE